ncbi:MAG: MBG domain-containing protein, partial [Verrucomicrobiota bacterium]
SNITVTLGSNPNYSVQATNSTLTIGTRTASVTADAKSKTYGDVNPALTATEAGTVNGDLLSYTLATDAAQFSSVGFSNITVTLGSNPNYSVQATNSTLTIGTKASSVTANNAGKNYGQTLTFTGTEFTSSGFVGGDTVTSVMLTSSGTTNTASVGTYSIVASAATGTGLGNYTLSYTNGTLTVNPATPVTANSPVRLPDGNFQLIFTGGDPGVSYVIQASDDLSNPVWSNLSTNTATLSGIPSFIDLSATNNPVRFYRTVIP